MREANWAACTFSAAIGIAASRGGHIWQDALARDSMIAAGAMIALSVFVFRPHPHAEGLGRHMLS